MNNRLRGGVLGHWRTVSLAEGYKMFHSVGNVIITDFRSMIFQRGRLMLKPPTSG